MDIDGFNKFEWSQCFSFKIFTDGLLLVFAKKEQEDRDFPIISKALEYRLVFLLKREGQWQIREVLNITNHNYS